uniref:Peptidase S1 domain-containing protein n=1 Tax=Anopheles melas TaxID=34690 RepID=A0A182UDP9_9DIPT
MGWWRIGFRLDYPALRKAYASNCSKSNLREWRYDQADMIGQHMNIFQYCCAEADIRRRSRTTVKVPMPEPDEDNSILDTDSCLQTHLGTDSGSIGRASLDSSFGVFIAYKGKPNDSKQWMTLERISLELCQARMDALKVALAGRVIISERNICTITITGNDAFSGFSGGPLMYRKDGTWYLIGLINYGVGATSSEFPIHTSTIYSATEHDYEKTDASYGVYLCYYYTYYMGEKTNSCYCVYVCYYAYYINCYYFYYYYYCKDISSRYTYEKIKIKSYLATSV